MSSKFLSLCHIFLIFSSKKRAYRENIPPLSISCFCGGSTAILAGGEVNECVSSFFTNKSGVPGVSLNCSLRSWRHSLLTLEKSMEGARFTTASCVSTFGTWLLLTPRVPCPRSSSSLCTAGLPKTLWGWRTMHSGYPASRRASALFVRRFLNQHSIALFCL